MTTYDELYRLFLTNCYTDSLMLPQNVEQQYDAIHNAVFIFNNKLRSNLGYEDDLEQFDRVLNSDEKLVLIHCMRLTVIKNTLTFKNSIFTTFTKEIGVRNISAQVRSLEEEIKNEESTISEIIFNMDEESIM